MFSSQRSHATVLELHMITVSMQVEGVGYGTRIVYWTEPDVSYIFADSHINKQQP